MKSSITFPKGGVHPHDKKELSRNSKIEKAEIPDTLIVPMSQHLGKPADLLLQAGSPVREGELIGKLSGNISSNIHSPVSGTIKEIEETFFPNGVKTLCAVIERDKNSENRAYNSQNWENFSPAQILDIIKDSGIVGLGGATFPAHFKFSIPSDKKLDYLIINGVECEPYLTSDYRIMMENAPEIFTGIKILQKLLNPAHTIVGIEKNKMDAVKIFHDYAMQNNTSVKIGALKVKYPQGDEKQLIKALTGRSVPSGGLPLDIGAVVSNVSTVFSIYEAVALGKPVVERVVTVTGSAVKNPSNLRVKVGTSIKHLIEACGGFKEEPYKIIAGGPMMGFSISSIDMPVTKGLSGIICLTAKEAGKGKTTPCISCGRCAHSCPFGLNPTYLFKMIDHENYSGAMDNGLMDCKECGCCAYSCPSYIELVQGLKLGKKMARNKK